MFYNAYYFKVESLYVMCPLLVWVGLMGGGSYVNVLHGILELKTLKKSEKEMAMSLSLLFNGINHLAFIGAGFDNYQRTSHQMHSHQIERL